MRCKMMGNVFNIQRISIYDGQGIRTVVFLKGCPLSCVWWHNPESKCMQPEMFYDAKNVFNVRLAAVCVQIISICLKIANIFFGVLLAVRVFDNGAGIPKEKLKALREQIANDTIAENAHIGLSNVAQRYHLVFGSKSEINIHSSKKGTIVAIKIMD